MSINTIFHKLTIALLFAVLTGVVAATGHKVWFDNSTSITRLEERSNTLDREIDNIKRNSEYIRDRVDDIYDRLGKNQ